MGNLKYVKGDLFSTQLPVLVHGVNCQGVFGAGVAKQVAHLFPDVKEAYLGRQWSPGEVQFCSVDHPHIEWVVNCATQDKYGRKRVLYADYKAIHKCLEQVFRFGENVAMPMIGCGLGGGDWGVVEQTIRDLLEAYHIDVEVYYL